MAVVRPSVVLVLCTFLWISPSCYGAEDPCTDHQSINDPYRSTKNELIEGETAICDNKLTPGWYRFTNKVGGKMPTKKPEPYQCGTVAPIWMKGTHPTTKGDVATALACTNINNRLGGCMIPKPMAVKNCGEFFVYKLQPSAGCAMAYCAGNLLQCPKGQTGIVPNCKKLSMTPFPFRLVPVSKISPNTSPFSRGPDSGELKSPAEENMCPNDCSNHGNCTNRACICEEGYTSADCSMSVNPVPNLLGIHEGGLCDIRKRPCKHTHIFGHDFINSENLTCHVEEIKVIEGNWSVRPYPQKYPGKMVDIFGVRCNLPDPPTKLGDYDHEGTPAGGLSISISNDGEMRSIRRKRFVSYDSHCVACTNSSGCQQKNESCLINGHCFAANKSNPKDWCLQCLPADSMSSWTPRKVNQPPKFADKQSTRWAINGEYLPLQLKATDPDDRPVTYSLISSTATGYTFSPTGLLSWNVTSQTNQQFVFNVTDECNATDTITINIAIVNCPCQNGGRCVPNPSQPRGSGHTCDCAIGFTGPRCESNIDDCLTAQCVNGTCVDGVNNYTCRCDVGFTGSLCDQRPSRCTNQTCFPGVPCTEISGGIACGSCPLGFSGDGKTCIAVPTTSTPFTTTATLTMVATTSTLPITTTAPPTTTSPSTTSSSPPTTTQLPTTTQEITSTTDSPTTTEQATTTQEITSTTDSPTTTEQGNGTTQLPKTQARVNESSTKAEKPTTTAKITETGPTAKTAKRVVKECQIRILLPWVDEYNDVRSNAFDAISSLLWKEIWASFIQAKNDNLLKVVVSKLRKGSIIAEFELIFKNEPKEPLKPIKDRIKDGKLGELEVDADSLTLRDEHPKDKKPEPKDKGSLIIIVIVIIVIAIVVIIIVIVVIAHRRKQKRTRNLQRIRKQDEDGKPGEMLPLTEKNSSK